MVAGLGLVLVLVVVVAGVVAYRRVGRIGRVAASGDRLCGTTFVIGLPPVPAPHPCLDVPPMRPIGAAGRPVGPAAPDAVLGRPIAVPRPVRRCGNCRAVGHTRPSCPRLTGVVPLPHL